MDFTWAHECANEASEFSRRENSIRIIIESKYFIYVLSIYSLIQFTVHLT